MRIKKLSIKNLGKHRQLDAVLDGSVVGLMGPNGSGKSTILKLIHFLITGWTPAKETQESFLRKVDPEFETEPTQGTAEIEFYAQGNTYRLMRKIGSPSSRKLAKLDEFGVEIKDETYTRADDIQATLTDILGADKYALDNAVFPEQGALDKILFGSQAEREELLVKLLLLGHMQKVADVAAGKIKLLSAEIQDFSTLYDELQSSRNAAEAELAKAEEKLVRTRSYDSEIKLYDDWLSVQESLVTHGQTVLSATNNARVNQEKRDQLLGAKSAELKISLTTVEDLEGWVSKLDNKITDTNKQLVDAQNLRTRIIQYQHLASRERDLMAQLAQALADMPEEPPAGELEALLKRVRDQDQRASSERVMEEMTEAGRKHRETLNIITAEVKELEAQQEHFLTAKRVLEDEIALYKTVTDTCKIALESKCTADCPVCGENVSHDKLQKRFEIFDVKLKSTQEKLRILVKEINEFNTRLRDKTIARDQSQASVDVCIRQYKSNKDVFDAIPLEDVFALREKVNELNKIEATRAEIAKRVVKLKMDINTLRFNLSAYTAEDIEIFNANDPAGLETACAAMQEKVINWKDKLTDLNKTLASVKEYQTIADMETRRSVEYKNKCIELEHKKNELYVSFSPALNALIAAGGDVKTKLTEANKEFIQLQATTKQLKEQANGVKKRLKEIEDKIRLDEEKRKVIADLQRVVAAFSRQGIPMAYVQHKFDSLVSMAQENLEIMDANFAIIPHPTKPVSLQFYRVDEPGQVLFDHDKLSGGQKVRLSIAFLLAVQQLVIPDLGFLVLDEPSTHLDEEARENLKELLLNLNQQLETTDTQILVCDHAKELEPAFVNVIQL